MAEEVKLFGQRLCSLVLTEETIIEEKLDKFIAEDDPRIIALINHSFFATEFKFTNYLKAALENNPRASESIRKKVLNFISVYVSTHHTYMVEHVKGLFSQLLSHYWKEEGKVKEISLRPIMTIIEVFDEEFLVSSEVINPGKLHGDIMSLLQTQKLSPGVIGECWHLLAVIQHKFSSAVSPA